MTATPVDGEYVDARYTFLVQRDRGGGAGGMSRLGVGMMKDFMKQITQDIPIWENKIQHEQPLLCDGDGPIGMFRRWCQQFYARPQEAAAAE